MTRRLSFVAGGMLAATTILAGQAISQSNDDEKSALKNEKAGNKQPEKGGAPGMAEMMDMMKKYMATIQPSEYHKKLEPFAGEWNTAMKMFMGGPGMPAVETKGTSSVKSILGGRYLLEEYKGEMMMPDATGAMKARPYEGVGLMGFDNYKKLYVGAWASNMGTELLTYTGAPDPTGKSMTMYGPMDEPTLDMHARMVKYVTKIIDTDKRVFEIYDLAAGDKYKVIEVTYTRKKP